MTWEGLAALYATGQSWRQVTSAAVGQTWIWRQGYGTNAGLQESNPEKEAEASAPNPAAITAPLKTVDMLQKDGMIDRLEERLKRTAKEVDARDETEIG